MPVIQLMFSGEKASIPAGLSYPVDVLVIAGGGSGYPSNVSGGGGAGGYLAGTLTLTTGNTYTAVVGAGGSSSNGSNSSFSTLVATGGGMAGGTFADGVADPANENVKGKTGGSGGGSAGLSGYVAPGVSGQGFSGAAGTGTTPHWICPIIPNHPFCGGIRDGGGGGAGGAATTWEGGPAKSSGIYWPTTMMLCKGGRGNDNWTNAAGTWTPLAGEANTGNGGDGTNYADSINDATIGRNGGSGIVIVRTLTSQYTAEASAASVVESGGYRYYKFTGTGSFVL